MAKGGKKRKERRRELFCSNFRASCAEKFEAKEKGGEREREERKRRKGKRERKRERRKEKRRKGKECFCPEEFPTSGAPQLNGYDRVEIVVTCTWRLLNREACIT